MSDNAFDDDKIMLTALNNTKQHRPDLWPKSTSQMRGHTMYDHTGGYDHDDTKHSTWTARPGNQWVWHQGKFQLK